MANGHPVELAECNERHEKFRGEVNRRVTWLVGGLATLSIFMFGLLFNKIEVFSAQQVIAHTNITKQNARMETKLEHLEDHIKNLLDMNGHKEAKKD